MAGDVGYSKRSSLRLDDCCRCRCAIRRADTGYASYPTQPPIMIEKGSIMKLAELLKEVGIIKGESDV